MVRLDARGGYWWRIPITTGLLLVSPALLFACSPTSSPGAIPLETAQSVLPDYQTNLSSLGPTTGVVVNRDIDQQLAQPGTIVFGKLPDVLKSIKLIAGYALPLDKFSVNNQSVHTSISINNNGTRQTALVFFRSDQLKLNSEDIYASLWYPQNGKNTTEATYKRAVETKFANNQVSIVSQLAKSNINPNGNFYTIIRGQNGRISVILDASPLLGSELEFLLDEKAAQDSAILEPLFSANKPALDAAIANADSKRLQIALLEAAQKETSVAATAIAQSYTPTPATTPHPTNTIQDGSTAAQSNTENAGDSNGINLTPTETAIGLLGGALIVLLGAGLLKVGFALNDSKERNRLLQKEKNKVELEKRAAEREKEQLTGLLQRAGKKLGGVRKAVEDFGGQTRYQAQVLKKEAINRGTAMRDGGDKALKNTTDARAMLDDADRGTRGVVTDGQRLADTASEAADILAQQTEDLITRVDKIISPPQPQASQNPQQAKDQAEFRSRRSP